MEFVIVMFIVGLAVFFVGRNFVRTYRGDQNCGCSGCADKATCRAFENTVNDCVDDDERRLDG